jgi:hypothetical protein
MYAHVIYAFDVQFGPLFLAYVAVLSLATWSFVGGVATLDRQSVAERFARASTRRCVALLLITIAALFSMLWLSQIVPALVDGSTPKTLVETGLATNPVHVLDLAFMLPATFLAGILLLRRHPAANWIAPIVIVALALISAGIVTMMIFGILDGG